MHEINLITTLPPHYHQSCSHEATGVAACYVSCIKKILKPVHMYVSIQAYVYVCVLHPSRGVFCVYEQLHINDVRPLFL